MRVWLAGDSAHCVVDLDKPPNPGDQVRVDGHILIAHDASWRHQMGWDIVITCLVGSHLHQGERIPICGAARA